ncbi:hypothetical protein [Pseudooceanicola sp.]|uniref:hypothetical protein n=1 Tax=Pseudooceanicola sp. TaxID=1914328 RepID=UPI00262AAAD1|nr:hypothetical protein [Pseudooceanicola sp.]MDF1856749.1 hypothetical protein [Pseudooceanicola sp.]
MTEFARLIALAITTFLVATVVTILSNPDLGRFVAAKLGLSSEQFHTVEGRMPQPIAAGTGALPVLRPDPGQWVGLTGFPSSAEIHFPLPHALPVLSGQLQLVLDIQMISRGDGLVRVSINGTEREALVLEPGEERRTLVYELRPEDLVGRVLTVALTGDGTTNQGQICPSNVTNLGVAVEINEASRLMLRHEASNIGAETALEILPQPLELAQTDTGGDGALPLLVAQYLTRMGAPAELVTEGAVTLAGAEAVPVAEDDAGGIWVASSQAGIARLAALRGAMLPEIYGSDWPVPISVLGADTQTTSFRGSRRWTLGYRLADMPEGRLPDRLDLSLITSRLGDEIDWNLRVTLNGTLIHSSSHDGRAGRIDLPVALPAARQALINEIEVTLVDPTPNQGICRAGPDAAAQMLDETVLSLASPGDEAGAAEALVQRLARGDGVGLALPGDLTLAAARNGAALLGLVLPLTTQVTWADTTAGPRIAVISDEAPDDSALYGAAHRYLVQGGGRELQPVTVERLDPQAALPVPSRGVAALLIEW